MKIISHRGCLFGPDPEKENHPNFISAALNMGFDCEIDLWLIDNKLVLGHDSPQYQISREWLYNDRLFAHCKNIEAFQEFWPLPLINSFFHNEDDCTATSQGWFWTFPRSNLLLTSLSIAVMPERVEGWNLTKAGGICTDYPVAYQKDIYFRPII